MPPGRGTNRDGPLPWDRVLEAFTAAVERPAEDRRKWLLELQDLDQGVRDEVLSLLDAHDRAGGFLDPGEIQKFAREAITKLRLRRSR